METVRPFPHNKDMSLLAVKLLVTPLMVLAASLVGRRWGETVGAWLVGLPLTSGPVAIFLAIERGPQFAYEASAGSIAGVAAQAAFCMGYAAAAKVGRLAAALSGTAAYIAAAATLEAVNLPHLWLVAIALAALAATLRLLSAEPRAPLPSEAHPAWEIPVRVAVVTALVIGVTSAALALGPSVSGVVASLPFIGAMMALVAHRARGPAAGIGALRGMAAALPSFAAFFFVVSLMIRDLPIATTFLAASAVAVAIQFVSLSLSPSALAAES